MVHSHLIINSLFLPCSRQKMDHCREIVNFSMIHGPWAHCQPIIKKGTKMVIITKDLVRYTGILSHADQTNPTIFLDDVDSYGTEGRKEAAEHPRWIGLDDPNYDFADGFPVKYMIYATEASFWWSWFLEHDDPTSFPENSFKVLIPGTTPRNRAHGKYLKIGPIYNKSLRWLGCHPDDDANPRPRVRGAIRQRHDDPPAPHAIRRFADWAAKNGDPVFRHLKKKKPAAKKPPRQASQTDPCEAPPNSEHSGTVPNTLPDEATTSKTTNPNPEASETSHPTPSTQNLEEPEEEQTPTEDEESDALAAELPSTPQKAPQAPKTSVVNTPNATTTQTMQKSASADMATIATSSSATSCSKSIRPDSTAFEADVAALENGDVMEPRSAASWGFRRAFSANLKLIKNPKTDRHHYVNLNTMTLAASKGEKFNKITDELDRDGALKYVRMLTYFSAEVHQKASYTKKVNNELRLRLDEKNAELDAANEKILEMEAKMADMGAKMEETEAKMEDLVAKFDSLTAADTEEEHSGFGTEDPEADETA